ncbi:expressed unknown protein [Seminavis robusta]|uniref:Uncharacterized protein n=1 Tax=Seminavis robusta TaxID=568900 RepID=A0A9N8I1C8_9STRA|nr:expressed unknown protein [Seminavis robusta]|eukprot:Sro3406_g347650.1 n/a (109) ;mRNA; f:671-997
MPFAVLSFNATDGLQLARFVLSCPDTLKAHLEDALCVEFPEDAEDDEPQEEFYCIWKGNDCVLSKGYYLEVHDLLNKIEMNGWKIDQFSTSLTGSGVQCQTYVFQQEI